MVNEGVFVFDYAVNILIIIRILNYNFKVNKMFLYRL